MVRDRCCSLEPNDYKRRISVMRLQLERLVAEFALDNPDIAATGVKITPLVNNRVTGVVIGARPAEPILARPIDDSDILGPDTILGRALVFSGSAFSCAILTPGMAQPVYGEMYTIPATAIDALSPQLPLIIRQMR